MWCDVMSIDSAGEREMYFFILLSVGGVWYEGIWKGGRIHVGDLSRLRKGGSMIVL